MTKNLMTGSFVALITPFANSLRIVRELGLDKKYGYNIKPMSLAA